MAALPTFDTLKAEILTAAQPLGVFPGYWDIMRSIDYSELITAIIPWVLYCYRSGIITDAMLAEFDEVMLNENGIYTTNAAVPNPGVEVFALKNAVLTIDINDGWRHNINVMGGASAAVNISGNSFVNVTTWGTATANVTLNDSSVLFTDSRQQSVITVIQTAGTNISELKATDDVVLSVNAASGAYSRVQAFGQSKINQSGAGAIEVTLYELSQNPILS